MWGQFLGKALGMGTVSAAQEKFILLIGKARMTRLEKTPMGAGISVGEFWASSRSYRSCYDFINFN